MQDGVIFILCHSFAHTLGGVRAVGGKIEADGVIVILCHSLSLSRSHIRWCQN